MPFDHETTATMSTDLAAAWLRAHDRALIRAASRLGGARWRERAMDLVAWSDGPSPALPDLPARLRDMHRLLCLDAVDDPEEPEAVGRFAAISPAAPIVIEICQLTDSLADLLDATERLRTEDSVRKQAA